MAASISSALLEAGFRQTQAVHGESVTVLSGYETGRTFTAVILTQPQITISTDLGEDAREKVVAHFAVTGCPAFESGNAFRDSGNNVWKVVGRNQNPSDNSVEFELVKIVTGKDA